MRSEECWNLILRVVLLSRPAENAQWALILWVVWRARLVIYCQRRLEVIQPVVETRHLL